ncbi:hypothetical protein [Aquariibacter albus]|uniref:Uncharacterized protein n=1 Tax=Aquariibacter albus TaxID=2759899 RepID=A0A839HF97_9BURK|nr:hypothetical protein [Aquariibacter albus]MBB1160577.1 hypothetical protein [Aquariibacter albus]
MDAAILSQLLLLAAQLSDLPAGDVGVAPHVEQLPLAQLHARVCPDRPADCRGMQAHHDPAERRILLADTLDLAHPVGRSFLLHELVHALEAEAGQTPAAEDCEAVLRSERRAYRAQDAFLRDQGQRERFGDRIEMLACQSRQGPGVALLEPALHSPGGEWRMLQRFMEDLAAEEARKPATAPPAGRRVPAAAIKPPGRPAAPARADRPRHRDAPANGGSGDARRPTRE